MDIADQGTALITGASSGIGEALAKEFAQNGFNLIITARREDRLISLSEELSANVQVDIVVTDLATQSGIDYLIQQVSHKHIDILVNNAGIDFAGSFQDQNKSQLDTLLSLNIIALTQLVHHFLPGMIKAGAGRILNVASVAAFHPIPSFALYAASKAFVLSLTESIAVETKNTGVTATALCPGLTRTEATEALQAIELPNLLMASAEAVAREGYEALMNREVIRVPGITNQAALAMAQHQPRWLVRELGGLLAKFNPKRQA
ncbi:MAG: SDR family oxidoreductase [Pseudomonadales bacterium]|nr:SDR family oxidoreductase [Pseudomonadales bacterium]